MSLVLNTGKGFASGDTLRIVTKRVFIEQYSPLLFKCAVITIVYIKDSAVIC